ncbi:dynein light chain Tctex-type 1-like [Schistocerca cancellata]|uniref:dynein light chain Tctex-type 1-like n=1 Tax=Schistocerca cancellata TaxID=274614 RepID=UPI002117C964|nr:dynein light chain Tctex-type 1-like [Schistocerca cancellata]
MDDFAEEETEFVVEEVTTLVKECVEKIVGRETFQRQKCELYVHRIAEACISALARLNKPFKYIGTSFRITGEQPSRNHDDYDGQGCLWTHRLLYNALLLSAVTVEVAQNDGCGRHGAFANLWDAGRDKCCNVIWKNDVVLCIVTVIGLHI